MKTVILVTIKEPSRAKLRLSALLTPEERARLAWVMFCDVARALDAVEAEIVVVTGCRRAAQRATELGWRVIQEAQQISESASVDAASLTLELEGKECVLRIPADIPLVRATDIEEILALPIAAPYAAVAPSRDGSGSNALLRTPPTLFPSRFGPGSLVRHTREALEAGAPMRIVQNERLALDLDDRADLLEFTERATDTMTFRLLLDLRIPDRLAYEAARSSRS
jgi:2-phospho-L-lactate guanylyltransferase